MKFILILAYAVIGSLGMVLIRLGGINSNLLCIQNNINISISITFIIGFLLYFISFSLFLIIIQKFNLIFFSPISYGIIFVITSIFSYFLLDEVISGIQYLGACIIIIGVIIISFSKSVND